jgi:5-methylcytosine-specific restriction endonuclease McrBC regulatory subunit McrC
MIQAVDNYYSLPIEVLTKQIDRKEFLEKSSYYCLSNSMPKELHITLKDYKEHKNNFILFESEDSEDDLVISIKKIQVEETDTYTAQTGNYIGKFKYNGIDIDIKSRFSDTFLKRMLNFANNVYLDDVDISGKITKKEQIDYSKFILHYLFVQTLEKAFLLGLPKSYTTIKHHDMKLKGNIDINRFIKNDIPFKGKVSSKSREQKEIQEIIDVLHKTVSIIEKSKQISTKNISHIKTHLKQHKSNNFISNQTIQKALNSKALNNPIFSPYKKVLEYAKYIINANSLEQNNGDNKTYGFIINVSMLFEMYITKLLKKEFSDWNITSPEIELYQSNFFARKIIPDIVMEKDKQILVFDAKYKRMTFNGKNQYGAGDLDRNDFFQINTYMSYYQNSGYEVVAGGLLYPMEKEFDCRFNNEKCKDNYNKLKAHSNNWFGNDKTKFIVDGIDLSYIENNIEKDMDEKEKSKIRMKNILNAENNFIDRIQKISENTE